ncbi:MAG: hypothetical protein AAFY46_14865, partial [Planctomycetota bacterium]
MTTPREMANRLRELGQGQKRVGLLSTEAGDQILDMAAELEAWQPDDTTDDTSTDDTADDPVDDTTDDSNTIPTGYRFPMPAPPVRDMPVLTPSELPNWDGRQLGNPGTDLRQRILDEGGPDIGDAKQVGFTGFTLTSGQNT